MRKVYIFTVSNICSGGPEALHQLAYYCNKCGIDAYTVYFQPETYHYVNSKVIDRYQQYGVKIIPINEIEDTENNICIAPESAPWCLNNVHHAKKVVWWLSVSANRFEYPSFKQWIVYKKRYYMHQNVEHLHKVLFNDYRVKHVCGSNYAYQYVSNKYSSLRHVSIDYLVEPISLDFLQYIGGGEGRRRRSIVLYNPSKGSARMSRLLIRSKYEYVPLQNYTPSQLVDLYSSSKLYVDFGEFGGPERMPKEAVYFGCNILVSFHNAAVNDFDVAIPRKWKVDDNLSDDDVENIIGFMLENYTEVQKDFSSFREKIRNLEDNFILQIKHLFVE